MQALSHSASGMYDILAGAWPPSPKFTEKDLPDLAEKVFLVTGGTSGIGLELCKILYSKSATVYLTGRNSTKAATAMSMIRAAYPDSKGTLRFVMLDLADLSGIKASAEEFLSQVDRLDVVWHNAGLANQKGNTKQGHEMQLGVNAIGPWLLQHFLTPLLEKTARMEGTKKDSVRVIWVSSSAHVNAPANGGILWNDINLAHTYTNSKLEAVATLNGAWPKYGQSKAANIILGAEAAKRWASEGIISLSVHPGLIKTPFHDSNPTWMTACLNPVLHTPHKGALTYIYAGLSPQIDAKRHNGAYIIPWGRVGKPREDVARMLPENGKRLWVFCDKVCKDFM